MGAHAYWEIRNADGGRVTARATLRQCREILDKYATDPPSTHWQNGPYTIWRVTEERRLTHRPRPPQPAKEE